MTLPKYDRSADAKAAGWFSRRHRDSGVNAENRENRIQKIAWQEEQRKLRKQEYNKLSVQEKLDKLDFGGYTAKKQREKLTKLLAN